jgi:hypothetical protein
VNSAGIPRATAGSEWNERNEVGSPEGAKQYQFISASGPTSSTGSTEWSIVSVSLVARIFPTNVEISSSDPSTKFFQFTYRVVLDEKGQLIDGDMDWDHLQSIEPRSPRDDRVLDHRRPPERYENEVTVVVPCRNEAETVPKIATTFRGLPPAEDVIVVDNDPDDSTATAADQAGAHVVEETRVGKGHAVLAGLDAADTDFVFWIDGDIENPSADWLYEAIERSGERHRSCGSRLLSTAGRTVYQTSVVAFLPLGGGRRSAARGNRPVPALLPMFPHGVRRPGVRHRADAAGLEAKPVACRIRYRVTQSRRTGGAHDSRDVGGDTGTPDRRDATRRRLIRFIVSQYRWIARPSRRSTGEQLQ